MDSADPRWLAPRRSCALGSALDGFIAGPNEGPDNGLGDGGERLHDWLMMGGGADAFEAIRRSGGVNARVVDEFMATGAIVAGRGTFEPAGGWGGDHHDGVPIFILTRHDPDDLRQWPLVTYVDDVTSAMTQAKEAAGDESSPPRETSSAPSESARSRTSCRRGPNA